MQPVLVTDDPDAVARMEEFLQQLGVSFASRLNADDNWLDRIQDPFLLSLIDVALPSLDRQDLSHVISLADNLADARDLVPPPCNQIVLADAIESVKKLTVPLMNHLKTRPSDARKLPWNTFEHLVAELLAANGFSDVALVGRDPSTSADIFAVYRVDPLGENVRFFVEVKRTKDRVGIGVINAVYGAMILERPAHGWDIAMIISLGGFTECRKLVTTDLSVYPVRLKDEDAVQRWLVDYQPTHTGLWLPKPDRHTPKDNAG